MSANPNSADVFIYKLNNAVLGLNEYSHNSLFNMYPNPANEFVNIIHKSKSDVVKVNILDLT
ncbi:MAG: hypothetical protein QNK89_02415, partial [Lacinutrix sp.]|uniref:hypothetical protein n=1 Tax=Lacinutrix sp. TaxID=1937692 RepID=UPI0030A9F46E